MRVISEEFFGLPYLFRLKGNTTLMIQKAKDILQTVYLKPDNILP